LPQLVDRLDDRFRLLVGADRTAAPRHRSLEAAVQWSYQLLSEQEQEIFCRLAMFPGPFTLEAAESVAGPAAGQAVLHFVDCSLLIPQRDAGSRYLMLQTLRAFGLDRLAKTGQRPQAIAAVIAYAVRLAEDAATGMDGSGQEVAAARRLDAESAITQQALAWALEDEPVTALRLAVALAPWWLLRGQSAPGYSLLQRATQQATSGGDPWSIGTLWLGHLAHATSNFAIASQHFTTVLDTLAEGAPSAEKVDALVGRSGALRNFDHVPEAADDARRALGLARELGYPAGEAMALIELSWASGYAADVVAAVDWASQAQHIDSAGIPDRVARERAMVLATALAESGQAAPAQRSCTDLLPLTRASGDLGDISYCLWLMAELDLQTDQMTDVPAHLHESLRLATKTGEVVRLLDCLETCGYMCVATGRWADAITIWAARDREDSFLLPGELKRRQEQARKATQALRPAQARAAEERGQAMNLATATEFATMLTAPGSDPAPTAPALAELSARERELVTLVARGNTDAQIAGNLFISISTVRSHLDRIRDKTSCRRRADLTRLALQAGLV
jgi:DNA-binding CsgD family transcriptional regulator